MSKPLFEGSITDVHGIRVGQAQNREALTGVTVVLCGRDGAVIGADVRGAAPGTREIALTRSENTVERANAVMTRMFDAAGYDDALAGRALFNAANGDTYLLDKARAAYYRN